MRYQNRFSSVATLLPLPKAATRQLCAGMFFLNLVCGRPSCAQEYFYLNFVCGRPSSAQDPFHLNLVCGRPSSADFFV